MLTNLHDADNLADFQRRPTDILGEVKVVYRAGTGPAVIIMAEMPGISPHVARFARWVRDAGFTVYMPSLFGTDGAVPTADEGAAVFRRTCVSAEFRALGAGVSSPVTLWLRGLARLAHGECGGPGVGAVGMCFTGNFALTMMLEPSVLAPVVCQPSLPLDDPAGLENSGNELGEIAEWLERENLSVLGHRFSGDAFCRAERFAAYAKALGPRFDGRVLPDPAPVAGTRPPFFHQHVPAPHSVVTVDLVDRQGEPTLRARDEIIAFFNQRLSNL